MSNFTKNQKSNSLTPTLTHDKYEITEIIAMVIVSNLVDSGHVVVKGGSVAVVIVVSVGDE